MTDRTSLRTSGAAFQRSTDPTADEHPLARSLQKNRLSRRQALWLLGASGVAGAGLQGCAQSPVTGERIVVGMSEAQERAVDAEVAPHQFSQDLGALQDAAVNDYVSTVGQRLQALSHRPQMPYSYRVLNANYVNAYTFPGGAMGVTRGILADLQDESELAALLGHEIGHVNARHAAQRQGQSMLAQVAVLGLNIAAGDSQWGGLVGLGSQVGASALLAGYSREHEREADALGQQYLVKAGYPASGMTRLHSLLVTEQKAQPGLLETMFSSHPMSSERLENARRAAETTYAASARAPAQRERFMDHTASLRRIKPTIADCQQGELAMAAKTYPAAQTAFASAIKRTPQDYAANFRMAQCLQAQNRLADARRYAEAAQGIYPQEAQAHKLSGVLALSQRDPGAAFAHLDRFDRQLPGDPGVTFLKGVALEGGGQRPQAAAQYRRFLQMGASGQAAQYANSRLQAWGALR